MCHDAEVLDRGSPALLATVLVSLVVGCGGNDTPGSRADRQTTPAPRGTTTTHARARSPEAVIRGWSETLRRGDVAGAARYFAIPSLVSNGTPPIRLTSRAQVVAFNRALPCGAKLVSVRTQGGLSLAAFRLTERKGGLCADAVGGAARTLFRIRDGKIAEWRRAPDVSAPADAPET